MEENLKRLTVVLPADVHEKLKLLSFSLNKSMRDCFIEAITMFIVNKDCNKEVKQLRHKLYRMKFDAYEESK